MHAILSLLFVAATAPEACPEDALQLTLREFNMSNLTVCERAELAALISAEVSLDNLPNKLRAAALPAVNPMPWGHRYSSAAAGNTIAPTGVTPTGSESTDQRPSAKRARPIEQPVKAPEMKTPKVTRQMLLPAGHCRVKLNKGLVIATIEPSQKYHHGLRQFVCSVRRPGPEGPQMDQMQMKIQN